MKSPRSWGYDRLVVPLSRSIPQILRHPPVGMNAILIAVAESRGDAAGCNVVIPTQVRGQVTVGNDASTDRMAPRCLGAPRIRPAHQDRPGPSERAGS